MDCRGKDFSVLGKDSPVLGFMVFSTLYRSKGCRGDARLQWVLSSAKRLQEPWGGCVPGGGLGENSKWVKYVLCKRKMLTGIRVFLFVCLFVVFFKLLLLLLFSFSFCFFCFCFGWTTGRETSGIRHLISGLLWEGLYGV